MIRRLPNPLVHGAWTRAWWAGEPGLTKLFGAAPDRSVSAALSDSLTSPANWWQVLRHAERDPVDPDAVVVLAGQQPVLGGGALLVAHKAATAIALARALEPHVQRPVVPVFLMATQDHDTSEVDHLDLIRPSNGNLERLRCPLLPRSEMFARCSWDATLFESFQETLSALYGIENSVLDSASQPAPAAEHVARLLEQAFAGTGLRLVEAHTLGAGNGAACKILDRALAEPELVAAELRAGESRLRACGFPASFDAADPRPLVLESRDGRRRRIEAGDLEARARLTDRPEDFSPHAALRPIVQAATLPVVAQVCGPSEILYLGQARGLHEVFGVTAPQLVPRLEATRVRPDELDHLEPDLRPPSTRSPLDGPLATLLSSLEEFRAAVGATDPGIAPRADRFSSHAERGARALADAPGWRGRGGRADERLRPRGRPQDAVLGWLPEAFGPDALPTWAEDIIGLSRPFEPPVHVLHALAKESL